MTNVSVSVNGNLFKFQLGNDILTLRHDQNVNTLLFVYAQYASNSNFDKVLDSAKSAANAMNPRSKIQLRVYPGEVAIVDKYIEKEIYHNIRYDASIDAMTMVYDPSKPVKSETQKYKILSKVHAIRMSRGSTKLVDVFVTLDYNHILKSIGNSLNLDREFGGTMRLTGKKFDASMSAYVFNTRFYETAYGPDDSFTVNTPSQIALREKGFITFHTHPAFHAQVYGVVSSPPSGSDYALCILKTLTMEEIAHMVFCPEGVYTIEVDGNIRSFVRPMTREDKDMVVVKFCEMMGPFNMMFPESCPLKDISAEVKSAGGKIIPTGDAQRTRWILTIPRLGIFVETSNFFDIVNILVMKKIISPSLIRRDDRMKEVYTMISETLKSITVRSALGEHFNYIAMRYGMTEKIANTPIIKLKLNQSQITNYRGWNQNFTKDMRFKFKMDLDNADIALGKSINFMSTN